MFLSNYLDILFFLLLNVVLGLIIFAIPTLVSKKFNDIEKLSSYECGFNPFIDTKIEFEIKFYIVAILFIIFDLEISLLFPFAICINSMSSPAVYSMLIFLIVLTVGFLYE